MATDETEFVLFEISDVEQTWRMSDILMTGCKASEANLTSIVYTDKYMCCKKASR